MCSLQSFLFMLLTSVIYLRPVIVSTDILGDYVENFKAFTVASNETDGFREFVRSAKFYNIPVEVLGFGTQWKGGNMMTVGGGYKVNLLREAVQQYKDDKTRIIMFSDSYDVLYLTDAKQIINKFLATNAGILFSAENWIWPSKELEKDYPPAEEGYKFLNSGGFIGYANLIGKMLDTSYSLADTDDDQLFYTKCYLDETSRESLNIKLDRKAEIFQNLFGNTDDLELKRKENKIELFNTKYNTQPCLLHGNSLSKFVEFRSFGNYLAGRWTPEEGCVNCDISRINLDNLPISKYPSVVIGIVIQKPTPFFTEFLDNVVNQNYPKRKVHLFIHNEVPYHESELDVFISRHKEKYRSIKVISDSDQVDTVTARQYAIDYCLKKSCDFYLNLESDTHLDFKNTLVHLIQLNKTVAAPMIKKPYKAWSNFWGALDNEGYYKRSQDYMDIVKREKLGLWNVPYISGCYLINGTVLRNAEMRPDYSYRNLDYDMAFCEDMRKKGVYLFVDNREDFGHLTDLDGFDVTKTNPNMYELFDNRWDWERRYLHPEYREYLVEGKAQLQPCPDVYWFPIVSAQFCEEFIEIMESFGNWSDGKNNDTRLQGGYEAVPTRDIHMDQVGLDKHWLEFLRAYVMPLQQLVFTGYLHDAPRSLMNFVVRYKPDEQPSLRPHHDSSTYTINIALNRPNIDYEGGGCRFIRYDCQVTDTRLGWMLMHPGRLTHYHEGLLVTKGVRYIMISFVDP